jgi:hypothetical protein
VTWRVENWDVAGKDTSPGTSGDRQTVVEGSVARRRVLLEREAVVVVNAFVRVVVVVVVVAAACFAIELCWTYVVVVVAVVVQVLRVVWGSRLCWMKTAAAEMNLVFFVVAVAAAVVVVVVVVDIDGMKTCRAAFETDSISTLTRARMTSGNPRLPQTSVLGWRSVAAAGKEPDPGWQGIPSSAAAVGTWPRGLT